MDDRELMWREIERTGIVRDPWIDLRASRYRLPDGAVRGPFYTYSRRDYAVVVPRDADGNIVCVRQFRQGIGRVTTEFPAGGIEWSGSGRSASEALAAARRELLEETGYVSDCWRRLLVLPANATIADNYAYVFAAEDCRRTDDQRLDETEFLRVELLRPAALEALILEGGFQQAVHVMAWLLAQRHAESGAGDKT